MAAKLLPFQGAALARLRIAEGHGNRKRGFPLRLIPYLLAATVAVIFASPAQAVTLVHPDGTPVGGQWQAWADAAKIPTIPDDLSFQPGGCGDVSSGCSIGPVPPWPATEPSWTAASDKVTLWFELGHQFDWQMLTSPDRRYLARLWGTPDRSWWDSPAALLVGHEDGLEGAFAGAYQFCAEGQGFDSLSVGYEITQPDPEATCDFIRRVASGLHGPPTITHAKHRQSWRRAYEVVVVAVHRR